MTNSEFLDWVEETGYGHEYTDEEIKRLMKLAGGYPGHSTLARVSLFTLVHTARSRLTKLAFDRLTS